VSRIGKVPIAIPDKVTVTLTAGTISVKGPRGELRQELNPRIKIEKDDGTLRVVCLGKDKKSRAFHGLYQRLISNMIQGVTTGYKKELEIIGVGYRAQKQGTVLQMQVGYSQPVTFEPPGGIEISVPNPTAIEVSGFDKQLVGEVAAQIRRVRPPEPYKGKGIRYAGEFVRRKVGKAGVK